MKKILLVVLCALALGTQMSQATRTNEPVPVAASSKSARSTVKSVFQNGIGKYPFDINLLTVPAVENRLVALLGAKRYNFMVKNFDVETPIEFTSWNFHTMACQAHNCGTTEFEISYNPDSDALAVRYRVDDKEQIFKEKKSVNAIWDY